MTDQVQAEAVVDTSTTVETPSTSPAIAESERMARDFMQNRGISLPEEASAPQQAGEESSPDPTPASTEVPTGQEGAPAKPPARSITPSDHYKARQAQRQLQAQRDEARAKLEGMKEAMAAFPRPDAPAAPEEETEPEVPTMEDDPKGHIAARFSQMEKQLQVANEKAAAYDKFVEEQNQKTTMGEALGRVQRDVQAQAQAHEKANPGYMKRAERLIKDSVTFFQSYGATPEQAGAEANRKFQAMVVQSIKTGVSVPSLVEEAYQARFGEQDARESTLRTTPVRQAGQDPHVAAAARAKADGVTATLSSNGAANQQQINARNTMKHGLSHDQAGELLGAGGVGALSALHAQMQALNKG